MPRKQPIAVDPASRPQPAHTAAMELAQRLHFEWDAWGRARANYGRQHNPRTSRERRVPADMASGGSTPRAILVHTKCTQADLRPVFTGQNDWSLEAQGSAGGPL